MALPCGSDATFCKCDLCVSASRDRLNQFKAFGTVPGYGLFEPPRLEAEGVLVEERDGTTYYTRICGLHHWATGKVDSVGDLRSCPGCAAAIDIVRDGGRARYDALVNELLHWL